MDDFHFNKSFFPLQGQYGVNIFVVIRLFPYWNNLLVLMKILMFSI